eukprot:Phypoly_transcript_07960.p1 GENE.Phypoly_transcript_07960~~Phypoly_transcript_07960.p1  ORF type:complete len:348 (+),score=-2.03 Phypoly_transcript_07960:515-1558(+)
MNEGHAFTEHQQHTFWAAMFVVTTCSIIASSLIILSYILLPKTRNVSNRIVVSLSIADLGTSLCGPVCADFLLRVNPETLSGASTLCVFQAVTIVYFSLASICWIGVIAVSNFLLIVRKTAPSFRMEMIFHTICWGLPLIPTILALTYSSFGFYDLLWCAYARTHIQVAIACLTIFIVPVLTIIVYCYFSIIWHIRKNRLNLTQQKSFQRSTTPRTDVRATIRMSGFIIIYIITWFPYFITYVVTYTNSTISFFETQVFFSALAHSQGVSNFFLYCMNRDFIHLVHSAFATWFPSTRQRHFEVHSTDTSPRSTPFSTPHSTPLSTPTVSPSPSMEEGLDTHLIPGEQ